MAKHGGSTAAGFKQQQAVKAAKKAAVKLGITTAELYKQQLAASKMSAKDYAKLRSMEIAGIRGSSLNRFRSEARWRYSGKPMSAWYKMVAEQERNRRLSQKQARGLGGSSKPGAKTTTTTRSARTAQGSGGFGTGFTLATKKQGFTAAPVGQRLTRAESIKSERQQAAEAKTAFTTTKQKIESGRAAKAQALAEAKAPKSVAAQINEDAQVITRMISPREQAEAISRGEVEPSFVGQFSAEKYYQSALSGSTAIPRPQDYFGPAYGITQKDLKEIRKEEQPKEQVRYDYPQKPEPLGTALESTLSTLDKWQSYQPKNVLEAIGKTISDPFIGLGKATGTTSAFFYNIGVQAGALIKDREPKTRFIETPPTFIGKIVEAGIEGKDMGPVALTYIKKYGLSSVKGELAEIGLGLPGAKGIVKLIPLRYQKFETAGVQYVSGGKIVKPVSLAIGYGTKTKPIISKVGGIITKGKPDPLIQKVIITPETQKQLLRGVKLAADSTKQEQVLLTSLESVKKIEGITPISIKRAESVKKIIDVIGSETRIQPTKASTFGVKPFESITRAETPSLKASIATQQKERFFGTRLSPAEGSFGAMPYMGKGVRPAGDFDFSVAKYSLAKKAAIRTAEDIKPSPGRTFQSIVSDQKKSAKVYVKQQGKSEKVGEFLNPQEIDESGALQIITGDTLFGKAIPKGTDITEKIIHYQPFRQLLKKGESLFSIQKVGSRVELTAAPFREGKDVGDFINLAERWIGPLKRGGKIKKAEELKLALLNLKKTYPAYADIRFKPDPILMTQEPSTLNKLISSPITKDAITGVSSTVKPKPMMKKEVETRMETSSVPLIKGASHSPISLSTSLGKSTLTPNLSKSTSSMLSSSLTKKAVSGGLVKPPSVSSGSTEKLISQSILGSSSVTTSPKSAVSTITKSAVSTITKSAVSISLGSPSPKPSIGKSMPSPPRSPGYVGSPGSPSSPLGRASPPSRGASSFLVPKRKVIIPIGIFWKSRISEPKPRPRKYRKPFLGNVHIEEIASFRTKKTDIDYGKKVEGLAREDIRFTRKGKNLKRFVKETKMKLLSKSQRIFTPTKKQSKSFLEF